MALVKLDLRAPHQKYIGESGREYMGVTTYLSVIAKPPLIDWAAKLEREKVLEYLEAGLPLPEARFHSIKRDRAADLGTITHARIEAWLQGNEVDPDGIDPDLYAKSENGLGRFRDWWDATGMTLLHSELQMVSDWLEFGGTADVLACDRDGRLCLVDIKTSKASRYWPYDETLAQVAAYAELYIELYASKVDRIMVWRVGTEPDDPGQVYELTADERGYGWQVFGDAKSLFNNLAALQKARKNRNAPADPARSAKRAPSVAKGGRLIVGPEAGKASRGQTRRTGSAPATHYDLEGR